MLKKLYIVYKYLNNPNQPTLLQDPSAQDLIDLAIGRWTTFKSVYSPEFVVKLSRDDESILWQVTLAPLLNKLPKPTQDVLKGHAYLAAVSAMIDHVKRCHASGATMHEYIKAKLLTQQTVQSVDEG